MRDPLRVPRPLHRRLGAVGLVVAVGCAALAGCAGPPSADPAATPSPTPTPSLTQEQQDAATFESIYAKYIAIPLESENEETLTPLLSGQALSDEVTQAKQFSDAHQTFEGRYNYSAFKVTQQGDDFMIAQLCLDASGAKILDENGKDLSTGANSSVSMQLKATRSGADKTWRISEIVRNDEVKACG